MGEGGGDGEGWAEEADVSVSILIYDAGAPGHEFSSPALMGLGFCSEGSTPVERVDIPGVSSMVAPSKSQSANPLPGVALRAA